MITSGLGFCDSPLQLPIAPSIYLSEAGFHQTSNYPQEELAKFGYRAERKVFFLKIPAVFWRPPKTHLSKYEDVRIISLKSGVFGTFFSQKAFVLCCAGFLGLATVHKFSLSKALI